MKDTMNPCHHTLSEDIVYKEVVVIGEYYLLKFNKNRKLFISIYSLRLP